LKEKKGKKYICEKLRKMRCQRKRIRSGRREDTGKGGDEEKSADADGVGGEEEKKTKKKRRYG
jgi:hypothetical protein